MLRADALPEDRHMLLTGGLRLTTERSLCGTCCVNCSGLAFDCLIINLAQSHSFDLGFLL